MSMSSSKTMDFCFSSNSLIRSLLSKFSIGSQVLFFSSNSFHLRRYSTLPLPYVRLSTIVSASSKNQCTFFYSNEKEPTYSFIKNSCIKFHEKISTFSYICCHFDFFFNLIRRQRLRFDNGCFLIVSNAFEQLAENSLNLKSGYGPIINIKLKFKTFEKYDFFSKIA